MKYILNLNLDYNRKPEVVAKVSNGDFTLEMIEQVVHGAYPRGVEGQKRRIFGRLQRKCDDAISENKKEIEIEHAEFDFLYKAITKDDTVIPSPLSRYINILEDHLEDIKTEISRQIKEKGSTPPKDTEDETKPEAEETPSA